VADKTIRYTITPDALIMHEGTEEDLWQYWVQSMKERGTWDDFCRHMYDIVQPVKKKKLKRRKK
jgi:hypothetical protein